MFSTKLSRVAHRAATTTTPSLSSSTCTAAARSTQCLATHPSHQRRPSSSKTSCPPDSSKPAPAEKAAAETDGAPSTGPTPGASAPQSTNRKKRSRGVSRVHGLGVERMSGKGRGREAVEQFAGLPAVPGVQHLNEKDLTLSSFFSLHRPLSVTTTIPPPSTPEAFNNLFESRPQQDAWTNGNSAERRPEDVIYTLHTTIETLENYSSASQDEGVRWEVLQESQSNSDGVKHLDGAPQMKSLEELVAQFKPFRAPPPPQPFTAESKQEEKKAARTQRKQRALARGQPKLYSTTITISEFSEPDGQKSYSATSSPIVRVVDPNNTLETITSEPTYLQPQIRQPFLERMRRRQQLYLQAQHGKVLARMGQVERPFVRRAPSAKRVEMILISVKRQRKLKMKKHKYKKLMKRTRNLRRRLDRT